MTGAGSVSREAAGIEYVLRRSARARRLRLVMGDDGVARVTLPHRMPLRAADEFIVSKAAWIGRHRAAMEAERRRHEARGGLADGAVLLFAGEPHRLELHRGIASATRVLHADEPLPTLRVTLGAAERRPVAAILEAWLRRQAHLAVERQIAVRAPQLGVTPVGVAIRDQRTRWGSASRTGRLSFSWRLVLAPPDVLDYVVVHELAHLAVLGHSPAFWERVEAVLPDAVQSRRWLRTHARELHWSLDAPGSVSGRPAERGPGVRRTAEPAAAPTPEPPIAGGSPPPKAGEPGYP